MFYIFYTKINSKWLIDLNIRHNTIKLLEEITGKTVSDKLYQCFLRSVSQDNRNKNKQDLIKLTSFCIAKETIRKTKNKITYGNGGNICKQCNKEGLNFQNIQTAYTITKKANNPTETWKGDFPGPVAGCAPNSGNQIPHAAIKRSCHN